MRTTGANTKGMHGTGNPREGPKEIQTMYIVVADGVGDALHMGVLGDREDVDVASGDSAGPVPLLAMCTCLVMLLQCVYMQAMQRALCLLSSGRVCSVLRGTIVFEWFRRRLGSGSRAA